MKKNVMMRLASFLLVAVLLSTSAISGTYAKYVTGASGKDMARVAKFGVEVTSSSDLFSEEYETDTAAIKAQIDKSVASGADPQDKVLAPGTSGTDVAFTIKGTPEVAVKVDVKLEKHGETDSEFKDVFLKAGTYKDYTKVTGYDDNGKATYGTFTLTSDYHPIKWTLKAGNTTHVDEESLADVQTYLTGSNMTKYYDPNTNLATVGGDSEYTLSWEWAIETGSTAAEKELYNAADTLLGNLAAGTVTGLTEGTDYSLTVAYDLVVSVTQVD